jgi:hypothetical protein
MTEHNCRCKSALLQSYVDDELSLAEKHKVGAHLEQCFQCAEKLAQLRTEQLEVHAALKLYPRVKASPDFDLRVLESLELRQQNQNALLNFCDKLDAIFARPFYKIAVSSFAGLFCMFLILWATQSTLPDQPTLNEKLAQKPETSESDDTNEMPTMQFAWQYQDESVLYTNPNKTTPDASTHLRRRSAWPDSHFPKSPYSRLPFVGSRC